MAPPGTLTAHERFCLVLLCSQSDTVRRGSLRKTQTSTPPPTGSCQDPAMHSRRDFIYYSEIRRGCQLLALGTEVSSVSFRFGIGSTPLRRNVFRHIPLARKKQQSDDTLSDCCMLLFCHRHILSEEADDPVKYGIFRLGKSIRLIDHSMNFHLVFSFLSSLSCFIS